MFTYDSDQCRLLSKCVQLKFASKHPQGAQNPYRQTLTYVQLMFNASVYAKASCVRRAFLAESIQLI